MRGTTRFALAVSAVLLLAASSRALGPADPHPADDPLTDAIRHLYQQELGRSPDKEGLVAYRRFMMEHDKDAAWLRHTLRHSPEGRSRRAQRRRSRRVLATVFSCWLTLFVLLAAIGNLTAAAASALAQTTRHRLDVFQCFWLGFGTVLIGLQFRSLAGPINIGTQVGVVLLGSVALAWSVVRRQAKPVGFRGRPALKWLLPVWLLFAALLDHGRLDGRAAWILPGFPIAVVAVQLVHAAWLSARSGLRVRVFALLTVSLCLTLLGLLKLSSGTLATGGGMAGALMVLCMAQVAFWLVMAPDPRFGDGLIWIWFGTAGSLVLAGGRSRNGRRCIMAVAVLVFGVLTVPYASMSRLKGHGLHTFETGRARANPTRAVELRNGQVPPLVVHVPVWGDQVGDAPLPATPYPDHRLHARRPGLLRHGFRMVAETP